MKRRTKLFGALVTTAMVGALLLTTVVPAGSSHGGAGVLGRLDFFANGTDGDGFWFVPDGSALPSATETFTSNNQGRLIESGDDLATLTPSGPGSSGQLYTGLKDHQVGVHVQGEGVGTPAALINGVTTATQQGQTLEIALGPDTPGAFAWYAQFALKFKFGAKVLVEALDSTGAVVASVTKECSGSDCGPDSGNDRLLVTVGNHSTDTLFTSVRISIALPSDSSTDGAVGLVDDPTGTGGGDLLDTYFEIPDFDGVLSCDESASVTEGGVTGEFTRLNTSQVLAACGTLKVYNLQIAGGEVQFEPQPEELPAMYRGDLQFPVGTPSNPLDDDLEYDQDGLGPIALVLMQWGNLEDADGSHTFADGTLYFPELAGLGTGGVDAFPTLTGLALENGNLPTSCIVAFSTVQGGLDHWVVYLEGDPFYI